MKNKLIKFIFSSFIAIEPIQPVYSLESECLSPSSILFIDEDNTNTSVEEPPDERSVFLFVQMYNIFCAEIELNENLDVKEKRNIINLAEKVCSILRIRKSILFLKDWLLLIENGEEHQLKNFYEMINEKYRKLNPVRRFYDFKINSISLGEILFNKRLYNTRDFEGIATIIFDFSNPLYKRIEAALYGLWILQENPRIADTFNFIPNKLLEKLQNQHWINMDSDSSDLISINNQKVQFSILLRLLKNMRNYTHKILVLPIRKAGIKVAAAS